MLWIELCCSYKVFVCYISNDHNTNQTHFQKTPSLVEKDDSRAPNRCSTYLFFYQDRWTNNQAGLMYQIYSRTSFTSLYRKNKSIIQGLARNKIRRLLVYIIAAMIQEAPCKIVYIALYEYHRFHCIYRFLMADCIAIIQEALLFLNYVRDPVSLQP